MMAIKIMTDNPTQISENTQVTAKALVQTRRHVRLFNLAGIKKATSAISGMHDSRFRGRGMDYQESRAYQAGDDIRNMDWRVTARTGVAHTKLFQEERERPIYLLVDCNPSMHFATRRQFKSVVAAQVATTLGWSAIQQGDRVGVMTYGCGGVDILKATAGKKGMMAVIQQLVKADQYSEGETALDVALKQLRSVLRPGVILLNNSYHRPLYLACIRVTDIKYSTPVMLKCVRALNNNYKTIGNK